MLIVGIADRVIDDIDAVRDGIFNRPLQIGCVAGAADSRPGSSQQAL